MALTLNRTTDPATIDRLATLIVERVFATLKPPVSQYPDGIQIGIVFIRPEEDGRRFDILLETTDAEGNATGVLDHAESVYSLHEAITRALVLQLEPQVELAAFDVVVEESKKA